MNNLEEILLQYKDDITNNNFKVLPTVANKIYSYFGKHPEISRVNGYTVKNILNNIFSVYVENYDLNEVIKDWYILDGLMLNFGGEPPLSKTKDLVINDLQIGSHGLANINGIETIKISGDKPISSEGIFGLIGLKEVDISIVGSIGQYAIRGCNDLKKVVIGGGRVYLNTSPIYKCENLEAVYLLGDIIFTGRFFTFNTFVSDLPEKCKIYIKEKSMTNNRLKDSTNTYISTTYRKLLDENRLILI